MSSPPLRGLVRRCLRDRIASLRDVSRGGCLHLLHTPYKLGLDVRELVFQHRVALHVQVLRGSQDVTALVEGRDTFAAQPVHPGITAR
jgi:hypothetical protein